MQLLDEAIPRVKNTVTTEEVLQKRPALRKAAESAKGHRLPRGLRKAIRNAKPEITKENLKAQNLQHARELARVRAEEDRQRESARAEEYRQRELQKAASRRSFFW